VKLSSRKQAIRDLADELAGERDEWIRKNAYFYEEDLRYLRFLVPEGMKILDLGCGTGRLLASLNPSQGTGVDLSARMIEVARKNHPELDFHVGDIEHPDTLGALDGPYDVILMSETIGSLDDCEQLLANLHGLCSRETRIIIAYYSPLWEPILKLAELFNGKMPQVAQNWLSTDDIIGLLHLADFEVIKREWRALVPKRLLGLGTLLNRTLGTLPWVRRLSLRNFIIARPLRDIALGDLSATIVVPCRNERGNIEAAITRTPRFCSDMEFLFVEGGSHDGTPEEIERVIDAYPDMDIKFLRQDGKGKGDAVRKGFANGRGDVLFILDADLTTPPESLPKFYDALVSGKGNFINGSRLVYPIEQDAMRFLNMAANQIFSGLFSWLLNQRFTDTLCGTKVLTRTHYEAIIRDRAYFGDFDPFGDFDLIFGAAKQNLKIVEIPIRYAAREYGETQISRFRHGWLLLRMVVFAYRKLKAF
jgi:SAM-dependent methyltransferase